MAKKYDDIYISPQGNDLLVAGAGFLPFASWAIDLTLWLTGDEEFEFNSMLYVSTAITVTEK